jgi:hypothetical protein
MYSKSFRPWSILVDARGSLRDVVYLGWPITPSYVSPNAGEWGVGGCGVLANEYSIAHGTQINFGDRTPYLTYDSCIPALSSGRFPPWGGESEWGRCSTLSRRPLWYVLLCRRSIPPGPLLPCPRVISYSRNIPPSTYEHSGHFLQSEHSALHIWTLRHFLIVGTFRPPHMNIRVILLQLEHSAFHIRTLRHFVTVGRFRPAHMNTPSFSYSRNILPSTYICYSWNIPPSTYKHLIIFLQSKHSALHIWTLDHFLTVGTFWPPLASTCEHSVIFLQSEYSVLHIWTHGSFLTVGTFRPAHMNTGVISYSRNIPPSTYEHSVIFLLSEHSTLHIWTLRHFLTCAL